MSSQNPEAADASNPSTAVAAKNSKSSKVALSVIGVVVIVAVGFLTLRGLGDATVYFKTASEAVQDRDQLGEKRFRLEGLVVEGSITEEGDVTHFRVADKGTEVEVRHTGQPLGIFQENIPVVVEGHFAKDSDVFSSDRIMVRHNNEYEADHPERVSGQENL